MLREHSVNAASTFVDAVFWNVDVHSSLYGSALDVLQLLHCFFAHVLQLADMIVHIGDFYLASCPGTPGCYLPQLQQTHPCASALFMHLVGGRLQCNALRGVMSYSWQQGFADLIRPKGRSACYLQPETSNMAIWTKLVGACIYKTQMAVLIDGPCTCFACTG